MLAPGALAISVTGEACRAACGALRHDGPGGRLTATSSGRWKACTWRYGSGPACTRTGAGAGSSPAQPAGPGAGASAMPEATCGRRSARGSDSSGTPLAGCAASSLRLCVCRRGQGAGAGLAGRSTADLRAGRALPGTRSPSPQPCILVQSVRGRGCVPLTNSEPCGQL